MQVCLEFFLANFIQAVKKCNYFSFQGKSNYTQEVKLQMMKRCTPSELKLSKPSKFVCVDSLIRGRIQNFSREEGVTDNLGLQNQ